MSLINLFVRNRQRLKKIRNTSEVPSSPQETDSANGYENTLNDGTPIPGHSRGIVHYERDYKNTSLSWYDRLRSIQPLAVDWLRNTWGNVDESGRHIYDAMKRIPQTFVPYDKLRNLAGDNLNENGTTSSDNAYDTMERSPAVILPSRSEITASPTTENI